MNLQKAFFERIRKERQAEDKNFAQELAKFLHVSDTSAYRRINGQTPLTFDELQRLAVYYEVSLDKHLSLSKTAGSAQLAFSWQYGNETDQAYMSFLKWLLHDLERTNQSTCRIIFHAKDFPVFFNFVYPEIGEFKSFFWQKTLMRIERFKSSTFSCKNLTTESLELGQRIFKRYSELNSMELWNDEVLTSMLKQVQYAHEAKHMTSVEDTIFLLKRLKQLVLHIQEMAEMGVKYAPQDKNIGGGKFELYHDEIILGDNTILVEEGDQRRLYLSQNIIQGLITSDRKFVNNSYNMKKNLFKNSLLLSNSAEKERMRFFGTLLEKIDRSARKLGLEV